MGKREYLGEFEQLVLLAVLALGEDAYGMNVRTELEERAGREVSVPTVYSALDRLEAKGYATSHVGEPTSARGGRAKKYFQVTPEGVGALREARGMIDRMWAAAPLDPEPDSA